MKNKEFGEKMSRNLGKVKLGFIKHSPEILISAGVVGVVASAVLACKATTKLDSIVSQTKKDVEQIKYAAEHPEELPEKYTKEDSKKDLAIVYTRTGLKLAKLYAPAVTLGVLSISCILASNNIMRKRNVALAAAYTTVDRSFKDYRNRVVERFGEELDKELKYNLKNAEVEETIVDEKGKEKTVKKTVTVANANDYSEYARFYDDGCEGWMKDSEHNLWYLKQQQNYANDLLRTRGYLFLNEVYDMLGIPRTKAGQVVGWFYDEKDPNHDNFVDFGIFDITKESARDFVNGYERTILLDFNVDGPIIDRI